MAAVLGIISKDRFEKFAGKTAAPGTVLELNQHVSHHPAFETLAKNGTLFLCTVRPGDVLWLVAVLETPKKTSTSWKSAVNVVPITDISSLKTKIKFDTGSGMSAKKGALGMSLQTPRTLTDGDVALLRGATAKPATPAKAAKAEKPAKPDKAPPATKKAGAADPLDEQRAMMIDACFAQFEEVLADLKDNPEPYFKAPKWKSSSGLRGPFTETVQSIYSGAIDAAEACRMLGEELAPFVDGKGLAMTLQVAADEVTDADNLYGEIVDSFVIRAIEDLGRGLLALALDRPKDFPSTCETYRHLLERLVPMVKEKLAS